MKKRNHLILGAIMSFLFIYLTLYLGYSLFEFSFYSVFVLTGIIVFYSLLPDIDHKNSTITWWFFGIGVLGLLAGILGVALRIDRIHPVVLLLISTLLLVFTFVSANIFEHRGLIHSIPIGFLSIIPIYLISNNIGYCLVAYVAWHSHLIGDGYLFKLK